ncbi:MAG: methyltransferase [Candidatus Micrarchaeaceae archaeon]
MFDLYKEGKSVIKYTSGSFLNSEAALSRDISVAFVGALSSKSTSILDATSATGIRGIRYFLETPSKSITFLDINKDAFKSLKKNISFNKVKSKSFQDSIQEFANTTDKKFEMIDLDPFGGVTPYIYDLMKVSRSGTCLMITATDAAVLCGADFRACVRLYDAKPMHNEICQEVGLRLLIGYVARVAAQFSFGVEVLCSFSYLHYMRVFLRLHHGSKNASSSIKMLGYVHYCNKCLYRGTESAVLPRINTCKLCGSLMDVSGKVWLGNLNDKDILKSIKDKMADSNSYDSKSLELVDGLSNEVDIPLFYSVARITKNMGIGSISTTKLIGLLKAHGFSASRTHLSKYGIKTNASLDEIKACVKTLSKGI